jgi:hypothetical protein
MMSSQPPRHLEFATVPGGRFEIGWRFSSQLSDEHWSAIVAFIAKEEFLGQFSTQRTVALPGFAIARESISIDEVLAESQDLDAANTLADVCDLVDRALLPFGMRLPSEDELEVACGGELFPWGTTVPKGVPYGSETSFVRHQEPTSLGVQANSNPYRVELVRTAFKLGDGGTALCGGYPWPIPWFALAGSWTMKGASVEDYLFEFLEEARIRPVRI